VGNLIRRLNDTLGLTSILVSYDAHEALEVIDYVYFIADGVVVAQGSTEDVKKSDDPFVSQFIRALPDGPVPFHYRSDPYAQDLELESNQPERR
jgi:phospholipid/cholesterol/gamma-HCH transport system ATP-binding protein